MSDVDNVREEVKMETGDIVNVECSGGYWKGRITNVLHEWTHMLKSGKVLRQAYTSPIAIVEEIDGTGHALFHVGDLAMKYGEYYERGDMS